MENRLSNINLKVPFNSRPILIKALLTTVLCALFGVVAWFDYEAIKLSFRFILLAIICAVFFAITCVYWLKYLFNRRHFLRIDAERISWVNNYKNASVKWSFVREVNIVDLGKAGRSKLIVYDFTLDARESRLPSPVSLYAIDYHISHPQLLEVIEQASKEYNFQVILDRM